MKLRYLLCLVLTLSFLEACDEVNNVQPEGNDGDIVWVGNGLRLESSRGVLIDVEDSQYGSQSLLVTVDQFLPLVRSQESNSSVPVRLEWATADLEQGPVVQLERLDRKGECSRYQSQEGELVCSDILEGLPIKEGSLPFGLQDGSILYLDLFDSLHHFTPEGADLLLSSSVANFLVGSQGRVFIQSKLDQNYICLKKEEKAFVACGVNLDVFQHLARLDNGLILGVSTGSGFEKGVYQINTEASELLKAFDASSELVEIGETPDSIRIATAPSDFWIRLTAEGFEVLELSEPETAEKLKTQAEKDFTVTQTEVEGQPRFELCRSVDPAGSEISSCAQLMRSDEYRFSEVLLHYPEDLERPQLIAISERLAEADDSLGELSNFRLSVFEVFVGAENQPYLVQVSERPMQSKLKSLRSFDLRPQPKEGS